NSNKASETTIKGSKTKRKLPCQNCPPGCDELFLEKASLFQRPFPFLSPANVLITPHLHKMAEKSITDIFERFDADFPSIQPGEVKKMNEVIALLSGVQGALMEVGA